MRLSYCSPFVLVSSFASFAVVTGGCGGSAGTGGGMSSSTTSSASSAATTTTTTSSASTSASSSSTTASTSSGGTVTVTVSPNPANLLTCKTQKFTATVTNAADTSVKWSVMPPASGAIASDGTYTSPIQVPSPATATVTATSNAAPTVSGTAAVTLATIHPGTPAVLQLAAGDDQTQYLHHVAIAGQTGIAARAGHNVLTSGPQSVDVSMSTDGGKTWGASKGILDANPAVVSTDCAVTAVDPGDPKTAYVAYFDTGELCTSSNGGTGSGSRWILAVTKDGGATFTHHVLASNAATQCPDIVAPSPGHVVVSGANIGAVGNAFAFFSSSTKGDDLDPAAGCPADAWAPNKQPWVGMFNKVGVNGGNDPYGYESPKLFTDGKGTVCVAFEGSTMSSTPNVPYVSCSKDNGTTWGTLVSFDSAGNDVHLTQGAFGQSGEVVLGWVRQDGSGAASSSIYIATSPGLDASGNLKPFGATQKLPQFTVPEVMMAAPVERLALGYEGDTLFVAYSFTSAAAAHTVIDKSCDGGTTWSGQQLVNPPGGGANENPFAMAEPELQMVNGAMNVFAYKSDTEQLAQAALEP